MFPLNRYFTSNVPCVCFCPKGGLAEVIEVMLDQKFYQVICVENFGGGGPAADWKPHMIQPIAQARDFSKWQENDAQSTATPRRHRPRSTLPPIRRAAWGRRREQLLALCKPAGEGNYANQPGRRTQGS